MLLLYLDCQLLTRFKHYFLRLEHCNDEEKTSNDSAFTLWNTPFPPDLAACQVIDNSGSKPERLRCISLNDSLTGFSVFCVGGQTFGIFAHTATQPSAVKTYRKILQRIKQLIWIYFPLNGKEAIQEAWVRQKEGRGVFRSPTLMVGRTCVYVLALTLQLIDRLQT